MICQTSGLSSVGQSGKANTRHRPTWYGTLYERKAWIPASKSSASNGLRRKASAPAARAVSSALGWARFPTGS